MTHQQAQEFADAWIAAWNSHDLDRIFAHYADDFEMRSPLIVRYENEPSGRLVGKQRVRKYWQAALARNTDLHFELTAVYVGVESVVIQYVNQAGRQGSEAFFFNEQGLVTLAAAHYLES